MKIDSFSDQALSKRLEEKLISAHALPVFGPFVAAPITLAIGVVQVVSGIAIALFTEVRLRLNYPDYGKKTTSWDCYELGQFKEAMQDLTLHGFGMVQLSLFNICTLGIPAYLDPEQYN